MKTLPPELLTVREVARRLNLGVRTVWRWSRAGQLPAPLRLGPSRRTVRWQADAIERYLEQLAPPSPRVLSKDDILSSFRN